ncbi:MAG: hypothetical protein SR1Q5_07010 [Quinella sp. 1Q5]|nr:hypothetical protein [Quinella sp. 1Q5]
MGYSLKFIVKGNVVDILPTKALVRLSSANIMKLIEGFEGGAENIYFLDDTGRYALKVLPKKDCYLSGGVENIYFLDDAGRYALKALQKKDRYLSDDIYSQSILPLVSLAPAVFSLPIDEKNSKTLQKVVEAAFTQTTGVSELPIVGNDGHIVAVARLHKEDRPAYDWKKVAATKYGLPEGKLYVSSMENAELKTMFETFKSTSDMELMTEENVNKIISGKANGTLVYGTDIYPEIRKISVEELYKRLVVGAVFEKNQKALSSCAGFHMNFDEKPTTKGNQPKVESRIKSFLSQVESDAPIILEDAYDIEEITWMCDRLRVSDKFGSDNNLYLKYSSWADFLKSMENLDWTEIASCGKAVFLFGEEQKQKYYPAKPKLGTPLSLQIDEIVELVQSRPRSFSGSDFFNMILDSHPSLLTIGWHGLSIFTLLWKIFCKDKTVKEAVEHLRNPNEKEELFLRNLNLANMLKYKYKERLPFFLEGLTLYLNPEKKYGLHDWFKAFYLSANAAVGRKFLQRITPAIFYDIHGMNQHKKRIGFNWKENLNMDNELMNGFKYKRYVGVVRYPLTKIGSVNTTVVKNGETPVYHSPFSVIKLYAEKNSCGPYMNENNPAFSVSRHVRFEDLKLYPRETTEKLCEFLRIPWSESCLHITTNGEDSGIVDGTAGFDIKPVYIYKKHLQHLSPLDYYRIELLNVKNFEFYGYRLRYYDGKKYTVEDLKKLFDIPFKVETQDLDEKWPDWPNPDECKEFHEWILQRALDVMEHGEEDFSIDKNGNQLRLVEVLVPDLAPGQKLYEC